jgi:hypothetical protein
LNTRDEEDSLLGAPEVPAFTTNTVVNKFAVAFASPTADDAHGNDGAADEEAREAEKLLNSLRP